MSKMPLTDILQDNEHLIYGLTSICDLNFKHTAVDTKIIFFLIFLIEKYLVFIYVFYIFCVFV